MTKKRIEKSSLLCYAILVVVFVILCIRAQYSFCNDDETFYISLVHRLWCGDKLIVHEWHPTSLYAPLLYPFYAIYKIIVPAGEGIIFYFRIMYLCIALAISMYAYRTLCELGSGSAIPVIVALIYLMYARTNIWGMSYYNMFVTFNILTLLLLFNAYKKEGKERLYFFAGISFAAAVMCNPFLAPFVLVIFLLKINRKQTVMFLCGTIALFVYWCFFSFNGSFREIADNLVYLFRDNAHSESVITKIINSYIYIWEVDKIAIVLSVAVTVLFVSFASFKKTVKHKFIIVLADVLALIIEIKLRAYAYEDIVFYSINIMLLPFVINEIFERRTDTRLFVNVYVWGNILAMVYLVASNVGVNAKNTGYIISVSAGIILLYKVVNREKTFNLEWVPVVVLGMLVAIVLLWTRVKFVYRDDDLIMLDSRIHNGPAAGLITSQNRCEIYEELYHTAEEIAGEYSNKSVLVSKLCPWMYLSFNSYGTTTSWRVPLSEPLLNDYYEMHKEKYPQIIVVLNETVGDYGNITGSNKNEFSGNLWQDMGTGSYSILKYKYCDVYVSGN